MLIAHVVFLVVGRLSVRTPLVHPQIELIQHRQLVLDIGAQATAALSASAPALGADGGSLRRLRH